MKEIAVHSDTTVEWRPVKGFPDYEVSNEGEVRRISPVKRSWKNKGTNLTKSVRNQSGHQKVTLSVLGKYFTVYVHRIVAEAFIENPLNLPYVCHRDNITNNNRAVNLYWGTQKDNMAQMVADYRSPLGERNGSSKLTYDDVAAIKRCLIDGVGVVELGSWFGVRHCTISDIKRCVTWKHVIV